MENSHRMALVAGTIGILVILASVRVAAAPTTEILPDPVPTITAPEKPVSKDLSHAKETWISALEWCESQGDPTAINEVDRDGTPSFYSFQFKPGTFRLFGEAYGVIEKGLSDAAIMDAMKDTDLQRAIVRRMITDPTVDLSTQFPDCIRKIGRPPRS